MAENNKKTYKEIEDLEATLKEYQKAAKRIMSSVGKYKSSMRAQQQTFSDFNVEALTPSALEIVNSNRAAEITYNRTLSTDSVISGMVSKAIGISGLGTSSEYHRYGEEAMKKIEILEEYSRSYMTPRESDALQVSYDLEATLLMNEQGVEEVGSIYQGTFTRIDTKGRIISSPDSFIGLDPKSREYQYLKQLYRNLAKSNYELNNAESVDYDFLSRLGASIGEETNQSGVSSWENVVISKGGVITMPQGLTSSSQDEYMTRENFGKGVEFLRKIKEQYQPDFKLKSGKVIPGNIKVLIDIASEGLSGGDNVFTVGYNNRGFDIPALRKFINGNEAAMEYAMAKGLNFGALKRNFDAYEVQKTLPAKNIEEITMSHNAHILEPDYLDEIFTYAAGKTGFDIEDGNGQKVQNPVAQGYTQRYLKMVDTDTILDLKRISQAIKDKTDPANTEYFTKKELEYYRILSQIGASDYVTDNGYGLLTNYHYSPEIMSIQNMEKGVERILEEVKNTKNQNDNIVMTMLNIQNENDPLSFKAFNTLETRRMFARSPELVKLAQGKGVDLNRFFGEDTQSILSNSPDAIHPHTTNYLEGRTFEGGVETLEYENARAAAAAGIKDSDTHHNSQKDSVQTTGLAFPQVRINEYGLAVVPNDSPVIEANKIQRRMREELEGKDYLVPRAGKDNDIVVQALKNSKYSLSKNKSAVGITAFGNVVYVSDGYEMQYDNEGNNLSVSTDNTGKRVVTKTKELAAEKSNVQFSVPAFEEGMFYDIYGIRRIEGEELKNIQESFGKAHEGFVGSEGIISFNLREKSNSSNKAEQRISTIYITQEEFFKVFMENFKAVKINDELTEYGKSVSKDLADTFSAFLEKAEFKKDDEGNPLVNFANVNTFRRQIKIFENASRKLTEGELKAFGISMVVKEVADANEKDVKDVNDLIKKLVLNNDESVKEDLSIMLKNAKGKVSEGSLAIAGLNENFFDNVDNLQKMWNIIPGQTNIRYMENSLALSEKLKISSPAIKGIQKIALKTSGEQRRDSIKYLVTNLQTIAFEQYQGRLEEQLQAAGVITGKARGVNNTFALDITNFVRGTDYRSEKPNSKQVMYVNLNDTYSFAKKIKRLFGNTRKDEEQMYSEFFQGVAKDIGNAEILQGHIKGKIPEQKIQQYMIDNHLYGKYEAREKYRKAEETYEAAKIIAAEKNFPEAKKLSDRRIELNNQNEIRLPEDVYNNLREEFNVLRQEELNKLKEEKKSIEESLKKAKTGKEKESLKKELDSKEKDIKNFKKEEKRKSKFRKFLAPHKKEYKENELKRIDEEWNRLISLVSDDDIKDEKKALDDAEKKLGQFEINGGSYPEGYKEWVKVEIQKLEEEKEKEISAVENSPKSPQLIKEIEARYEQKVDALERTYAIQQIKSQRLAKVNDINQKIMQLKDSSYTVEARSRLLRSILKDLRDTHYTYTGEIIGLPRQSISVSLLSSAFLTSSEEFGIAEDQIEEVANKAIEKGMEEARLSKAENMKERIINIVTGGKRVEDDFLSYNKGLNPASSKQRTAMFKEQKRAMTQYGKKIFSLLYHSGATIEVDKNNNIFAILEGKKYNISSHIAKLDSSGGTLLYDLNNVYYAARLEGIFESDGQLRVQSYVENISRKLFSDENKIKKEFENSSTAGLSQAEVLIKTLSSSLDDLRETSEMTTGVASQEKAVISNATIELDGTLRSRYGRQRVRERLKNVEKSKKGTTWEASLDDLLKWIDKQQDKELANDEFIPNEVLKAYAYIMHSGRTDDGKPVFDTSYVIDNVSFVARTPTLERNALDATDITWQGNKFSNRTLDPQRPASRGIMFSKGRVAENASRILGDALTILDRNNKIVSDTSLIDAVGHEVINGIDTINSFGIKTFQMDEESKVDIYEYLMEKAREEAENMTDSEEKEKFIAKRKKEANFLASKLNFFEGGGFITGRYTDVIDRIEGMKIVSANKTLLDKDQEEALKIDIVPDGKGGYKVSYRDGYLQDAGEMIVKSYSEFKNDEEDGKPLLHPSIVQGKYGTKLGQDLILDEEEVTEATNKYIKENGYVVETAEDYRRYVNDLFIPKIEATPINRTQPLKIITGDYERHEVASGLVNFSRMEDFAENDIDKKVLKLINTSTLVKNFEKYHKTNLSTEILTRETFDTFLQAIVEGRSDSVLFKTGSDKKDKEIAETIGKLHKDIKKQLEETDGINSEEYLKNMQDKMSAYRYYLDDMFHKATAAIDPNNIGADLSVSSNLDDTITKHKNPKNLVEKAYGLLKETISAHEYDNIYSAIINAGGNNISTGEADRLASLKICDLAAGILRKIFPGADEKTVYAREDGSLFIDSNIKEMDLGNFFNVLEKDVYGEEIIYPLSGGIGRTVGTTIRVTDTPEFRNKPNWGYRDTNQLSKVVLDTRELMKISELMPKEEFKDVFGNVSKFDDKGNFVSVKEGYEGQSVFKDFLDSEIGGYYKNEKKEKPKDRILPYNGGVVGKEEYNKYTQEQIGSYNLLQATIDANNHPEDSELRREVAEKYGFKEVDPGTLRTDFRNTAPDSDMSALNAPRSMYNNNYIFDIQNDKLGLTQEYLEKNGIDSSKLYVPKGTLQISPTIITSDSEYSGNAKMIVESFKTLERNQKGKKDPELAEQMRQRIVRNAKEMNSKILSSITAKKGQIAAFRHFYPETSTRLRSTVINDYLLTRGKDPTGVGDLLYGDSGKTIGEIFDNRNGKGRAVSFMRVNTQNLKDFGIDDNYIKKWAEASMAGDEFNLEEAWSKWLENAKTKGIEVLAARQPNDYQQSVAAVRMYVSDDVEAGMFQMDSITARLMKLDSDGDNISVRVMNTIADGHIIDSSNRLEVLEALQKKINSEEISEKQRKEYQQIEKRIKDEELAFQRAAAVHTYRRATNDSEIWRKGINEDQEAGSWEYRDINGTKIRVTKDERIAKTQEKFVGLAEKNGIYRAHEAHTTVTESEYNALIKGQQVAQDIVDASGNKTLRESWANAIKLTDDFSEQTKVMTGIIDSIGNDNGAFGKIDNVSDEERNVLQEAIKIQSMSGRALTTWQAKETRSGAGQMDTPFDVIDNLVSTISMANKESKDVPFRLSQFQIDSLQFVKESAKEGFLTSKKADGSYTEEQRRFANLTSEYMSNLLRKAGTDEEEQIKNDFADFLFKTAKNISDRFNREDIDISGLSKEEASEKIFSEKIRSGIESMAYVFKRINPAYRKSISELRTVTIGNDPKYAGLTDSTNYTSLMSEIFGTPDPKQKKLFTPEAPQDIDTSYIDVTDDVNNPNTISPAQRALQLRNLVGNSDSAPFKFSTSLKGAGIIFGALSLLGAVGGNPATPVKNEEAEEQAYPRMTGIPPQRSSAMPQFLDSNLSAIRQGPNRGYIINVDARSEYDNHYTSNLISAAVQNNYNNNHINIAMNINQQRNEMSGNDIMNYLQASL